MNCNAAFISGKVDLGLLVEACSNIISCAFKAEAKVVDWALAYASNKGWRNLVFSSDTSVVVDDVYSYKRPMGWSTTDNFQNIKSKLDSNWILEWNSRSFTCMVDAFAKMALSQYFYF